MPTTVPPAQRRRWPRVAGIALVLPVIVVSLIAAVAPGLLPASPKFDKGTRKVAAFVIFVASYLALAIGKIPGLSIDRAGVALVGAGLMVASGVLSLEDAYTPLVIADIMRGTGRYNLAQGAIATVQGIGASLSGLAAGVIVDRFGYSAAFLSAGGAALVALIVFALRMPETAERVTPAAQGIATRPVTPARSQMRGRSRS